MFSVLLAKNPLSFKIKMFTFTLPLQLAKYNPLSVKLKRIETCAGRNNQGRILAQISTNLKKHLKNITRSFVAALPIVKSNGSLTPETGFLQSVYA
jgi:hypothetical protein